MVEAFTKRWGNHSSFKSGAIDRSGFPTFTVNHINGPVTYLAEGFLDKNLDALNPDFVSLLCGLEHGSDGSGSINPLVKGIFWAKAIATQAHPKIRSSLLSLSSPCARHPQGERVCPRGCRLPRRVMSRRKTGTRMRGMPPALLPLAVAPLHRRRIALRARHPIRDARRDARVVCLLHQSKRLAAAEST